MIGCDSHKKQKQNPSPFVDRPGFDCVFFLEFAAG